MPKMYLPISVKHGCMYCPLYITLNVPGAC